MKITIDRTTYEDTQDKIHNTEKGIECCGGTIRMVSHIDGRDFYGYTYNCDCGNVITSKTKRAKGDIMYDE